MAAATVLAAATGACGERRTPVAEAPGPPAPETAVLACQSGWNFADERFFKGDWRERAVIAGPVTLLGLDSLANADFHRRRAFKTKVLLKPHATTTIAVARQDRPHVSLAAQPPHDPFEPPDGDPAVRLEGCAPRVDDSRKGEEVGTGYAIAVIVDGPRCATFEITPAGGRAMRRTVSFGAQTCA